MKSKKKQNIVRVLFLLALFVVGNYYLANPINNKVNHGINSDTLTNVDILRTSGHWNLAPFVIDDSGETHNWIWAEAQPWCSGSGTLEDPYLIENVTIDGGNSGYCITIQNSDKYFRIENCTVFNSGDFSAGIFLNHAGNGTLINNNCSFNNGGISLYYSDNTTVSGNTANNNSYYGISLYYSNYTTVLGNTANNNSFYGIYLRYSYNNTISGNTANDNSYLGIYLSDSDNNNVSGNTANNNSFQGIYLEVSHNNTVSGNAANNNQHHGIYIYVSDSTTISGNVVDNNVNYGIYITSGKYNLIYKNYFINNGIHALDEGNSNNWNSSIIGNYWDNYTGYDDDFDGIGDTPHNLGTGTDYLPIWNFQSPIHIDDSPASPIDWAWAETQPWCSGFGTFSDPYVIDGLNITARGVGNGIMIENSNKYFKVRNCKLIESGSGTYDAGIRLDHVGNGTLFKNNCSFNNNYGIYLSDSDNNNVSGNTANNNQEYGIVISNSDNNTVLGNTANNNQDYGIWIFATDNNTISGNTANNNHHRGIWIFATDNNIISGNTANNNSYLGISLSSSDNNTISGNTVNNNSYYGIELYLSNSTTISGNTANNNVNYGIYTRESDYNLIYENYFINNGIHALDEGNSNYWDNGIIGNYWDDYAGVDANDDGIGDTPYIISGTAGSQDNFPIWTDGDSITPVITIILPLPDSVFGLVAPNYQITVDELNLDTMWYVIVSDGTTKHLITATTGSIDVSVWNSLTDGTITIRFYANDTAGNEAYSEVSIVKDTDTAPTPGIPGFNVIITLSVIFLVSIVIITRKKKLLNLK